MAKIGIHNGYWVGTDYSDMFDAMAQAAKAGADVYELDTWSIYEKSTRELAEIRSCAKDLNLQLICNGGFTPDNDIAADDPAVRQKGIDMACRVLKNMEAVGVNSWSGINYSAWLRLPPRPVFTMADKEHYSGLSANSLRIIVEAAKNAGVKYCLEIVNRYEQFLINTVAEGVALAERVGSDNVKLLLDVYHMNIEEDSITDAIRYAASKNRIGELHVGESNRRIPGVGATHMDWASIFGTLQDVGFEGPITMEPFVLMGSPLAYDIGVWRDISEGKNSAQLAADVATGIRFIRSFFAD